MSTNAIISPVVHAIGKIKFEGNIIPQAWYHCPLLRFPDGKVNLNAIIMLADIVYWYRPVVIRDEETGNAVGERQRFRADMLQRSYEAWGNSFGLTKGQATDAVSFLVKNGLIIREFRTIGTLNNVMYVEPVAKMIEEISPIAPRGTHPAPVYPTRIERDTVSDGGRLSPSKQEPYPVQAGEGVVTNGDTYTKTPNKTSLKTPKTPVATSANGVETENNSTIDPSLFGEDPKPTTEPTATAKPTATAEPSASAKPQSAVQTFEAGYFAQFGIRPVMKKSECILLAHLSKNIGEDFEAVIGLFLADTDPWVVNGGYAIAALNSRIRGYQLKAKGLVQTADKSASNKSAPSYYSAVASDVTLSPEIQAHFARQEAHQAQTAHGIN